MPHSPEGQTGQAANRTGQGQQPDQVHRAGSGRTRLRRADQRYGRHLGAHHWPSSSQGQDRDEKPRLQHAPAPPVASHQPKPCVRNARAKAQVMRNHLKIGSASTAPVQQSVK
jgi:hypothetical protein